MQGYLGRPEMTVKVMVHNPFNQSFKELVYVTGDIVTIDAEGKYVYVGREDGMIKTRGYRVELGKIEAILYGHQAIEEEAVLAIPDELIGNRICAAVKLHEGSELTREDVMAFCRQRLPRYMIPEVVEFRETIPKTSTGKTDRVGLAQSFVPE
jgi:acyl-CoA synthetase (AMP-forming)/AMP-acid ligase II